MTVITNSGDPAGCAVTAVIGASTVGSFVHMVTVVADLSCHGTATAPNGPSDLVE